MKKLFLMLGLSFAGLVAFGQELTFTKGDVAPGKIQNGRAYEDFLIGNIKVTDAAGNSYQFVRAEFSLDARDGKKLRFEISQPSFSETRTREIIQADDEGTVYTFRNVIVKDNTGKQFTIAVVTFEFPDFSRN